MAHIGQKNPAVLLLKQIITIAHQMKTLVTATGIETTTS
jgi:EAL domain-containing protein (putative c-di-GMP-specific phosphodiesterase class I)